MTQSRRDGDVHAVWEHVRNSQRRWVPEGELVDMFGADLVAAAVNAGVLYWRNPRKPKNLLAGHEPVNAHKIRAVAHQDKLF